MNTWAEKSFKIAKSRGYLDRISEIYPVNQGEGEKRVGNESMMEIKKLINTHKPEELISYLVTLDRFPFDDPYIGFLRYFNKALSKNPKTMERIWKRLERLGAEGIIEGINRPKSASRKFGNYFSKWLKDTHKVLSEDNFIGSTKGIVVLSGGDKTLKEFARKHLMYTRNKGLDFVAKVKSIYITGEAKFVSMVGGTQDKSVREVIDFVVKYPNRMNVKNIAILDGVPWVVAGSKPYNSLHDLNNEENVMSVLLFDKFLKSLN